MVCQTSVDTKIRWMLDGQSKKQLYREGHFKHQTLAIASNTTTHTPQSVLSSYLSFYNVYVNTTIADNPVKLFNSMLLEC